MPAVCAQPGDSSGAAADGDDNAQAAKKVYLLPGRLFVSSEPHVVTTILGSCVAVTLWDSGLRVGSVNHYLLPHWAGPHQTSARFGNLAVKRLIAETLALGGRREDLQAKIFGGARILEAAPEAGGHLGARNVEVARQILAQEDIPVVAEDTGGKGGRKLIFHTADGDVWVRRF